MLAGGAVGVGVVAAALGVMATVPATTYARSIIEVHQGTLEAENVMADGAIQGARFWFRLPVRPALAEDKTT